MFFILCSFKTIPIPTDPKCVLVVSPVKMLVTATAVLPLFVKEPLDVGMWSDLFHGARAAVRLAFPACMPGSTTSRISSKMTPR